MDNELNESIKKFIESCGRLIGLLLYVFIKIAFVMILWNGIVADVFGLPTLDYWQTMGIVALIYLILPSANPASINIE